MSGIVEVVAGEDLQRGILAAINRKDGKAYSDGLTNDMDFIFLWPGAGFPQRSVKKGEIVRLARTVHIAE